MRLTDKTERYSMGNKKFVGRKKNYAVEIHFSANSFIDKTTYWWYFLKKEDTGFSYNSLHDGLRYGTKDECVIACEKKIDSLTQKM